MGTPKTAAKALGKLFKNFTKIEFIAAQIGGEVVKKLVINPAGRVVSAKFKGHLHGTHDETGNKHVLSEAYHDDDGYEYFHDGDKIYRHDTEADIWYNCTPK